MARKAKRRVVKKVVRRQASRLERDMRLKAIVTWGVVVVIVLLVGVLGYGLVYETVIKARRVVATVDGDAITAGEFQDRVRYERARLEANLAALRVQRSLVDPELDQADDYLEELDSQVRDLENQVAGVGDRALDLLIREELVRREADQVGIAITPDELEQEIEEYFGYYRDAISDDSLIQPVTAELTTTAELTATGEITPVATPTPMTREAFQAEYDGYVRDDLRSLGVSEAQFRSWFEGQLLVSRYYEHLEEGIPEEDDQVNMRYLILPDEETAQAYAERWDAGETFEELKTALEADEGMIGGRASEEMWYLRFMVEEALGEELADVVFGLEAGERSEPVAGATGAWYAIVEVLEREVREIEPYLQQYMAGEAFQDWLDAQEEERVERFDYVDLVPGD